MTLFNKEKQRFCLTLSNDKRVLSFWISVDKLKHLLIFVIEPAHFVFLHNMHTFNKISNVTCNQITVYIMTCTETELRTFLLHRSWYDIFNCNWVATRWQLFSTHIHTNNTGNVTKQTSHRTTQKIHRTTQKMHRATQRNTQSNKKN
jgi:hypothetical protein